MATLTHNELIQAVNEWCERRGIPTENKPEVTFHAKHPETTEMPSSTSGWLFNVQIRGIDMPVKQGPFR